MTQPTQTRATIGVDMLRPLVRRLQRSGLEAEQRAAERGVVLLRQAGLELAQLADPQLRVPGQLFVELLSESARITGDPVFALRAGLDTGPDDFSLFEYVTGTAATLGDSMRVAQRYLPLLHDGAEIDLLVQEELIVWRHRMLTPAPDHEVAHEFTVGSFIASAQRMLGIDVPPIEVHFAHPAPAHHAEYARLLRAPVRCGEPWNAIVMPRAALDLPLVTAHAGLHEVLARQADAMLTHIADRLPLTRRVREQVRANLAEADSLERVAEALHMSSRTLRRRLAAEGSGYADILDDARRQAALQLLASHALSISEVSYAVGFAHPPAFQRACRRWFGTSPGAVREQRLHNAVYTFYRNLGEART